MNQQFTHFVGIDVSKKWLDLAWFAQGMDAPESIRVANDQKGIKKALKQIRKMSEFKLESTLFCLEHTGIYCYPFLNFAAENQLNVALESAWKIKRTHSPRGKNDKLDAQRICMYAKRYADSIRLWTPESRVLKTLRELMSVRQRLVTTVKRLEVPINELKEIGATELARLHERHSKAPIKALKKQIEAIEEKLGQIIEEEPELKTNYDLVTSIPGVGRQTAIWMIVMTGNFTRFRCPKKLACFCGVAPFEYSSGTSYRGRARVSHYANKQIKTILHMAAICSVRCNPELRQYFKRKVAEGKNKMLVINAVRNKIIHTIYAVIKRQSKWEVRPNNISVEC